MDSRTCEDMKVSQSGVWPCLEQPGRKRLPGAVAFPDRRNNIEGQLCLIWTVVPAQEGRSPLNGFAQRENT